MSESNIAVLPDRSVGCVTGEDAAKLLQGIITNDMDLLDTEPAIFAGLLSPQGKVLFDFLVVRTGAGFALDVAGEKAAELAKRLAMYRLRAKVAIEDASAEMAVVAAWPRGNGAVTPPGAIGVVDPRSPELGSRFIVPRRALEHLLVQAGAATAAASDYHAHRISLGIPEGGKDYDFGDAFPHEANLDLLGGVAFDKGCYIGQEIVARMQHRGTVRKRVVCVTGAASLPASRPEIKNGEVVIGRLGSVAGRRGLALLRLDRAIDAIDNGETITADGIALNVEQQALARHRAVVARKATSATGSDP